MKIEFEGRGFEELQRKLKKARQAVDLKGWMNRSCARVVAHSKKQRFRGGGAGKKGAGVPAVPGILTTRTGRLRDSIGWRIDCKGKDIIGRVGTNVIYGRIHEYGGTAGRNHAARIPPRPYLKPALEAEARNIKKDLGTMIAGALKRAGLK